ncbi:hypothetical protein BMS3Abin14_00488 [bacterium BMS3Abin14]|nr:hypothetical protein BMS3Abin14_00488 [bacterium BMS3Abin14]
MKERLTEGKAKKEGLGEKKIKLAQNLKIGDVEFGKVIHSFHPTTGEPRDIDDYIIF